MIEAIEKTNRNGSFFLFFSTQWNIRDGGGLSRRGTVAAVALPDTRQRLRRGAELLDGDLGLVMLSFFFMLSLCVLSC